jgi:predicted naringenin-chalcone synthase
MSSATVLYVLDRIARDAAPGPVFSAAFGPGLTVESALLEKL